MNKMKIYAVGIGPGNSEYLAPRAREVLQQCDVVVGYTVYVELVADLIQSKEVVSTGMKSEVERCERAFEEARKGKKVAVISSGDAGIYGMAPLLLEMSEKQGDVEIEVVPGITAAIASASILGSPLSNDFAVVSLSDLLTPWEVIEKRIEAASAGDFVLCLYNPQSHKRADYLEKACALSLKFKRPDTPCGYVKNALRQNQEQAVCALGELARKDVDMFTTVIIGNSATRLIRGKLVTARGYKI